MPCQVSGDKVCVFLIFSGGGLTLTRFRLNLERSRKMRKWKSLKHVSFESKNNDQGAEIEKYHDHGVSVTRKGWSYGLRSGLLKGLFCVSTFPLFPNGNENGHLETNLALNLKL